MASTGQTARPALHLQISLRDTRVGGQRFRCAGPDDLSLLDDRVPVGEFYNRIEMLVDDENGLALLFQSPQRCPDLVTQQGR